MIRIRDYVILILLHIIEYLVVILPTFLWNHHITIGYATYKVSLLIFGSLLTAFCLFYYFYKQQLLDWFVGIAIVISRIIECSYGVVALVFFSWFLHNDDISILIVFFIYIFFYFFNFSCFPLLVAIHAHIRKKETYKYIPLFFMVFAPILLIFCLLGFFTKSKLLESIIFLLISANPILFWTKYPCNWIKYPWDKQNKGLNYDN